MLLLLIVCINLLTVNCGDEKVLYRCVGLPRKKIMLDIIPVNDMKKLEGLKSSMSKFVVKKQYALGSEKISIKTVLMNGENLPSATTSPSTKTITSKINFNQYFYDHHYNSSLIVSDEILRILRQQALSILERLDGPCFVEDRSEILRFILLLNCVHNLYPRAKYVKFFIYDSSWLEEKYSSSSIEMLDTFDGGYSRVEEREEDEQYPKSVYDKSYLKLLENMSKHFQEHHIHALLMVSSRKNLPASILNYFNIFSFHQFHLTIPMKDAKNEKYIMIFSVLEDSASAMLCQKTSTDVHRNEIITIFQEYYFILGLALVIMVILILNYKENLYHIRCWILGNYMKECIILDNKKVKCDPYSVRNGNGKTIYLGEYMEEKIYLVGQNIALSSKGDWSSLVQIRELRNDNLAMFRGLVKFENNPTMFMAWEFCVRGSLSDILVQSLIDLDWPFKLSLLMDLSNGLRYLHQSSVGKHGWLTSKDCLVDNKWLLKVANFGLTKLYQQHGYEVFREDVMDLVWSAPEVIRAYSFENALFWGSKEGDVYSFAMIMSEVITGKLPFGINTRKQAEDLITDICRGFSFRPTIDNHGVPDEMINLMKACWSESPSDRPRMKDVHDTFRKHAVGRTLIDSMVQKLERYTTNLELLIEARTQELEEGRRMTESLLYRMLPVPVANSLRMGKIVEPEKFDEVTVYFSDIVGFTTIAAFSSPIEIITLLNDLYTCFDSVIDAYDVYKVETIGDAYMVVGGIPESNPDHAEQIATMALDILHHCARFRIKHIPRAPLRLRIGIHSGPVVAGIVGQTMPRYCLFGNTVNLASRMESTSRPFRIHISKRTHRLLTKAGGYIMKYRGEIDLKGRGKKPTYWLLGKEGFGKELPKFGEDESPNHGFSDCEILEIFGTTKISPDLSPASVTFHESESS